MSEEVGSFKPYVRVATREDCYELGPKLRQEDAQEVSFSSGLSPTQALLMGFRTGETYSVIRGDEVIAMFGCGGVPGVVGVPWMLASPEIERIRKSFLRECRGYVSMMLALYGNLENWVWAKNDVHIKWLEWLGFTIEPAQPFGLNDEPFHHFYMKATNV